MKRLLCKIFGHKWYSEPNPFCQLITEHVCLRCGKEIRD